MSADYSWPKEARLLKRAQFLALTDRRTKPDLVVRTRAFLVLGRLNGLPFCRLGLTVTKKVGRAVVRSRLKRRAREFFRLNRGGWPGGLDLVFIARIEAGVLDAADLKADLARVDARLAAWSPPDAPPKAPHQADDTALRPPGPWNPGRLLAAPALFAIGFYQRFISPFLPPACRFRPTCSHYAAEAISRHGLGRGGALAVWRLLRCQPWGSGGYDPVPPAEAYKSLGPEMTDVG